MSFSVSDPSAYSGLTVRLLRDDGAVVYINGTEVVRSNMPSGTINYDTPASSSTSGEDDFYPSSISASHLVSGNNVVAVEVHQSSGWSTDLGFDLEIIGTTTSGDQSVLREDLTCKRALRPA